MGIRKFFKKQKKPQYGWSGNYKNWQDAQAVSKGYDAGLILEKTKEALLSVKNGEAVFERDSFLFQEKHYPFPLISFLLHTANVLNKPLNVLDFGGSLGSTWYQVKDFFSPAQCTSWHVVEQSHYVKCGKQLFEDGRLKFFETLEESISQGVPDILVLSSVLHYLENPFGLIEKILSYNIKFILIDRTAFIQQEENRLTIQNVPPFVYEASYPSWFFAESRFLELFNEKYFLKEHFKSFIEHENNIMIDSKDAAYYKGFYFQLK